MAVSTVTGRSGAVRSSGVLGSQREFSAASPIFPVGGPRKLLQNPQNLGIWPRFLLFEPIFRDGFSAALRVKPHIGRDSVGHFVHLSFNGRDEPGSPVKRYFLMLRLRFLNNSLKSILIWHTMEKLCMIQESFRIYEDFHIPYHRAVFSLWKNRSDGIIIRRVFSPRTGAYSRPGVRMNNSEREYG